MVSIWVFISLGTKRLPVHYQLHYQLHYQFYSDSTGGHRPSNRHSCVGVRPKRPGAGPAAVTVTPE